MRQIVAGKNRGNVQGISVVLIFSGFYYGKK